jgi:hypothetical protein
MKKALTLSCALALAALSNVALAADGAAGFIRAELGDTDVDINIPGTLRAKDDDNSWALRGGYFFNANFGVEGFYANLYDKSSGGSSLELDGYGVGLVAKTNFDQGAHTGFFLSGRLGIMRAKGVATDRFSRVSDTSTELYFGVGAGYDFSETFGVSLNYDMQEADFGSVTVDADTLSVGAEVRF